MPYIELRARSAFSFGDGAVPPEALVAGSAELGYPALGLVDAAELGGVVRFALEAGERGIRPIVGTELRVDGRPMALLAREEQGYRNLSALVTRARVGSRRGQPGVRWAEVAERSAGLHLLTGPATGELAARVRAGRRAEAERALASWREAFGERMAVEVQLHRVSGAESALAEALIELSGRAGVPWVVTHEPRYLDDAGRLVHDLQTALRAGVEVGEAARRGLLLPNGEWRLQPPERMARLWRGREAGIEETLRIAEECRFHPRWLRPPLPRSPLPPGQTEDALLRERVYEGAVERWGAPLGERERAQIEQELRTIEGLGFAGFFLVMWRAVCFARSRGILCQGRGSAANSAVAFCLGITAVDPVRHDLLFERFLSEARTDGLTEAPDIDVDFEMHRREEVLDYVYGTYGRDHAALTAVTQTYHAPSALQDAMRALGYPAELAFRLSKRLHPYAPTEGAEVVATELAASHGLVVEDARGRALLTAMRALQDVPRMRSTHPGGFVLSAAPLGEYIPLEETTRGRTILQLDKDDLDALGIPKFDFLGLGGLTATRIAFDAIERRTGHRLEMYGLPQDDPKTFEMIAAGNTLGTFQIESRAQIQSLVQTRPEKLYDLVVQVALIRPGPIQADFVHPYTRRRRGLEGIRYLHPALEPILRRTQGIPIFQEQAMAIAMVLGGFSAAEADELRRTMGHRRKIPRLNAALQRLRDRMMVRGVEEETAQSIVSDFKTFANYGFPESHAWSFALIAYATAYLKAHYPAEFLLGLLNAWPMGFYSPATLVHDARRNGVVVLPPCLRDGEWECTVEQARGKREEGRGREQVTGNREQGEGPTGEESPTLTSYLEGREGGGGDSLLPGVAGSGEVAVRIGWRFIRGVGKATLKRLRDARAGGPFASVEEVVRRARLGRVEALHLARAGALEAFEPGRRRAAWEALRTAGDVLPLAPAHRLPFDPRELQGEELVFLDYLATGICTHGHPVEHLRERLRAAGVTGSAELEGIHDGAPVVVAGLVVARQHPETANGTVFVLLEDEHGLVNVIVPERLYEKNRETVKFSQFLIVEGKFERDGRVRNVVGVRFRELRIAALTHRSHDFR